MKKARPMRADYAVHSMTTRQRPRLATPLQRTISFFLILAVVGGTIFVQRYRFCILNAKAFKHFF